ncbi:hypothetical protein [Pseudomonas tohonis]|uniref:Uncharacterized protein n=1 Tax=Pseudomonas tohonis TaxID=2725477 RepID=A0ABQ4VSW7_9PSED|nr:hypothetical protein [Pseudomonas tohonis]GJN50798.1 hypothetical protein TUM20286_05500 [Pseudomonas tohonis]
MSDVKRYTTNEAYATLPYGAKVVPEADYDALAAAHEQAWKAVNSECQDWAREYEKRRAAEAERDQLRAELAAIRGQEPVAWQSRFTDDGEWAACSREHFDWVKREPKAFPAYEARELYALPPQQPEAVSVPRELLEKSIEHMEWFGAAASAEVEALRAILSTRQAEEWE